MTQFNNTAKALGISKTRLLRQLVETQPSAVSGAVGE
jgi:hypothetical protein